MWRPCSWPAVRVCLSLAAGALAFSLPLSLSHSLSLYVTFSFSLCLFLYQSSPLSVNDKVSSTPPTSPPAPVRGRLCSAEDYLAISGMAGRSGQKMSPLFFSLWPQIIFSVDRINSLQLSLHFSCYTLAMCVCLTITWPKQIVFIVFARDSFLESVILKTCS